MMKFKNKKEREEFIKNYTSWGIGKEVPELGLKFYRYEFNTGAVVIVCEYIRYIGWKEKYITANRMCLILPENDPYNGDSMYGTEYYKTYTLDGVSIGTITDYMTKNRDTIEV